MNSGQRASFPVHQFIVTTNLWDSLVWEVMACPWSASEPHSQGGISPQSPTSWSDMLDTKPHMISINILKVTEEIYICSFFFFLWEKCVQNYPDLVKYMWTGELCGTIQPVLYLITLDSYSWKVCVCQGWPKPFHWLRGKCQLTFHQLCVCVCMNRSNLLCCLHDGKRLCWFLLSREPLCHSPNWDFVLLNVKELGVKGKSSFITQRDNTMWGNWIAEEESRGDEMPSSGHRAGVSGAVWRR